MVKNLVKILYHYLKLWIDYGERPPWQVLLIRKREPTSSEVEYGLTLEPLAYDCLGLQPKH